MDVSNIHPVPTILLGKNNSPQWQDFKIYGDARGPSPSANE